MSRTREMERWGIPDWTLKSAYPEPAETDDCIWRWEFLRRRPDYRQEWEKHSADPMVDSSFSIYPRGVDLETLYQFGLLHVLDPRRSMPAGPLQNAFGATSGFEVGPWRGSVFGLRARLARQEPAEWPQRIADIEQLLLKEIEARDNAGLLDYRFDISRPLQGQIKKARRELLAEQETFFGKRNTPRPRKQNWPLFLRALDARECGASYAEMAAEFWPDGGCGGQKTEQSARDAFKQAAHLRDNFPI